MGLYSYILLIVVALFSKILYNTYMLSLEVDDPIQNLAVTNRDQLPKFDLNAAVKRLSKVIQFPSVLYTNDPKVFEDMWMWIKEEGFPDLFKEHCHELEFVAKKGKLLKCPAKVRKTKPSILLTSHLDVVPAPHEEKWTLPPFSGALKDGFIYGRGTLDDKTGVVGILEALTYLYTKEEWKNKDRDIFISVGFDEEIGGDHGAKAITDYLLKEKEEFAFVLDEGGIITDSLPGITKDVCLIAAAEKGDVTLKLTVDIDGGHSSYPKHPSAIGILANTLGRLEKYKMPANSKNDLMFRLLQTVAPYSNNFLMKMAISNQWLFGWLIEKKLSSKAQTDAALRTTTAITIVNAGVKVNVIPSHAEAIVNFRLAPGDTLESVIQHVKKTANDNRIKIEVYHGDQDSDSKAIRNPSPISCIDCLPYKVLQQTAKALFPETIVAPYLFIAGSDSKHYRKLSSAAYGLIPYRVYEARNDFARIHGIDERIGEYEYLRIVEFFYALTKNFLSDFKE